MIDLAACLTPPCPIASVPVVRPAHAAIMCASTFLSPSGTAPDCGAPPSQPLDPGVSCHDSWTVMWPLGSSPFSTRASSPLSPAPITCAQSSWTPRGPELQAASTARPLDPGVGRHAHLDSHAAAGELHVQHAREVVLVRPRPDVYPVPHGCSHTAARCIRRRPPRGKDVRPGAASCRAPRCLQRAWCTTAAEGQGMTTQNRVRLCQS